jgi:multiple sugar transport system permease protein
MAATPSYLHRASPRRLAPSRKVLRENVEGYLFISPFLVGLLLLKLGPMLASAYFSLTSWDSLRPPQFIGLENYRKLFFEDPLFLKSLGVTTYYVAGRLPLVMIVALSIAILLNQAIPGRRGLRTIYYLPVVTPVVATALLWMWIFQPRFGAINSVLAWFGVTGPGWISSPEWAVPSLILVSVWSSAGSMMVIYLAGLQGVPQTLYEAATIDGANWLHRIRHVTLPMITPVILFNLVLGLITSFQVFTNAYVMTQGGPANATMFYMLYLYNNAFQWLKMGYASAMAWVLFIILAVLTAIVFRRSGWVYYEGSAR